MNFLNLIKRALIWKINGFSIFLELFPLDDLNKPAIVDYLGRLGYISSFRVVFFIETVEKS